MRYAKTAAVLAVLLSANGLFAETLTQTVELPRSRTDCTLTASFDQIDPRVHIITSISIVAQGYTDGDLYHENTSGTAVNWNDIVTWSLRVQVPLESEMITVLNKTGAWVDFGNLGPFDGQIDYEGASGVSTTFETTGGYAGGPIAEELHDAFLGFGTIDLPVVARSYATMNMSIPGVLSANVWASPVITLTAETIPIAVSAETATWSEVKSMYR